MTAGRWDFAIRPAALDDAPAIRRAHEGSIRGLGPLAYAPDEVESWVGVLSDDKYRAAMLTGERFNVADAMADGVIAFCGWIGDEVKGLYVVPSWARRGVGSALLRAAEADITAAGHRLISIGATLVGRPFYQAHGYEVVHHQRWKTRGGLMIDTVDMEKAV